MLRLSKAAAGVAVLFAAGLVAAPALAQDTGTFRSVVVLLNGYTSLDHAGVRVIAGPTEGVGVTVESSAAPWVSGSSSRVSCVAFARAGTDRVNLEAPCTVTDSDGDTWFSHSTREEMNAAGGGGGKTVILGGTGKYAGITGSCVYSVTGLPDNWQTTAITCDWSRE